jgi:alkenylglycerophosphocholine hydrolase
MILGYDAERGFIFGLAAFFLAHICYIASMCPLRWQRTPAIALYLLFAAVLLGLLLPFLGSLLIPVLAYMSILLVMAIATLTSHKSNLWLIIGGLSFVCSDSLLGLDKFYQPIRYAPILIMTSYYLAQFALILGFIHYAQAQLNPAQTSNRQLES